MQNVVRGRLALFLFVMLLIIVVVGGTGFWSTRTVTGELSSLYRENLQASTYLANAERGLWELRFALPNYIVSDAAARKALNASTAGLYRQVEDNMTAYRALPLT